MSEAKGYLRVPVWHDGATDEIKPLVDDAGRVPIYNDNVQPITSAYYEVQGPVLVAGYNTFDFSIIPVGLWCKVLGVSVRLSPASPQYVRIQTQGYPVAHVLFQSAPAPSNETLHYSVPFWLDNPAKVRIGIINAAGGENCYISVHGAYYPKNA